MMNFEFLIEILYTKKLSIFALELLKFWGILFSIPMKFFFY